MLIHKTLTIFTFFACTVVSLGIQDVKDTPARVLYSSPSDEGSFGSSESTADPIEDLPELEAKVTLPVAWIKEYLEFKSHDVSVSLVTENRPLRSKFTNLERTMSNDEDLRSWTRYIIDHDRDEIQASETNIEESSVDLKIDEFISYLIDHKGFKSEDLQFLHRPDLDYGYEQIEAELSRICEIERNAQRIEVWGEALKGTRSCSIRTSFLLTSMAVTTSALLLSF